MPDVGRGDDTGGPYLTMAVLCEHVLEERNGVVSLIRLVNRVTCSTRGPNALLGMEPFPLDLTMVLGFKAGGARGRSMVSVRGEAPSGLSLNEMRIPVQWEGPEYGETLTMHLGFTVEHEGVYWFKVFVDDRFPTKVPLRVDYRTSP